MNRTRNPSLSNIWSLYLLATGNKIHSHQFKARQFIRNYLLILKWWLLLFHPSQYFMGSAIGLAIIALTSPNRRSRPSRNRADASANRRPSRSHPSHSLQTTLYLPPRFTMLFYTFQILYSGLSRLENYTL